jgi:outer membrane protein OmpA-like peptidoglycan-associated protein
MALLASFNSLRKRRPLLTYSLLGFSAFIALLIALRLALTPVAASSVISWLHDHGVEATIDDIELNISDGKFVVLGFDGKNADANGIHVGKLELGWQWKGLQDNLLVINRVDLADFHIDVLLYADGSMNIAGLKLPLEADAVAAADQQAGEPKPFSVLLTRVNLDNIDVCLKQFNADGAATLDYCTTLGALNWQGDVRYTLNPQNPPDDLPLAIKGTLTLQSLQAQNNLLSRKLISIGDVKFNGIQLTGLKDIRLQQLTVNSLDALQRKSSAEADSAHILAFNKLTIDNSQLQNLKNISIDKVQINNTASYLQINKDGTFEFADWVPDNDGTPSVADPATTPADTQAQDSTTFQYSIGQFAYNSTRPINFVDNSLIEPFSISVPKLDIDLGPIDSLKPEQLTHVVLDAITGRHAEIKLDAEMNPLSAKPDLTGKGAIAGLDLRALSPLTRQYIGHSIRSGQLDSDILLKADKGILDSKLTLTLNQFELRALNKKEAEALDSELGIPLNSSLSLLRDKDNRIQLEIPVTGDINKPDFDPADAITTATSKAISTAVLYYYTPFGLVLAADALFDLATALKFDPVSFEAGKSQLDSKANEQLDTLAKMLTDRPGVHLTLCGISNTSDITSLYPDVIKAAEQSESKAIKLDDAQNLAILKLAEQRGNVVKDYLVNNKKTDASRLIVCEPELRTTTDKPLVEISI